LKVKVTVRARTRVRLFKNESEVEKTSNGTVVKSISELETVNNRWPKFHKNVKKMVSATLEGFLFALYDLLVII